MSAADRRPVRVLEQPVPMRDGVRLSARIWLPADAERRPVPVLVESIPYRKRDGTRLRDEPIHRWFAEHGFASVRVDTRGTGDSEGVLEDEYSDAERQDARDTIEWLAAQPWCDGAAGMFGKSWGAILALQLAAEPPPALRAVIAVSGTDDRWRTDAHYAGGRLLTDDFVWGTTLMALAAAPPDRSLFADAAAWRAAWIERLDAVQPFSTGWMRHPRRDEYWRRDALGTGGANGGGGRGPKIPVWLVSGWADPYSAAIPRLLAACRGPRSAFVGPWGHQYPHDGVPGPAVGFPALATRFFERWLRRAGAQERGATETERDAPDAADEPALCAWLDESSPPDPDGGERRGRWIAEPVWPLPEPRERRYAFGARTLAATAGGTDAAAGGDAAPIAHRSPESVGLAAGEWCPFGREGDLPGDQRPDDARSLCFDASPLDAPFAILGEPVVDLVLAADRPQALVVVRLCEVLPGGASVRVAWAARDLATDDDGAPRAIVPGRPFAVRLRLGSCARTFARGSRLRVALSTSYWPILWPSPEPATLTVFPSRCALLLPERAPAPRDAEPPELPPPAAAAEPPSESVQRARSRVAVVRTTGGEVVHERAIDVARDGSPARTRFVDLGTEYGHAIRERFTVRDDDPASARAEIAHELVFRAAAGEANVTLRASLHAGARAFAFEAELVARDGDEVLRRRAFRDEVPRPGAGT